MLGTKPLGLGSTGRSTPANLNEKLAMDQAIPNPTAGRILPVPMTDARWPAAEGWVKSAQNINGIEIHYVRNSNTGAVDDLSLSEGNMLAICHANLGSAIPPGERYLNEVDHTDYSPLRVGECYVVYALLFIYDRVDFLVRAPAQPPFWVPSSLFDPVDSRTPAGWEFCMTKSRAGYEQLFEEFKISCVIGYPLLVNEYAHYVGVIERDPTELLRFMEEEQNQSQFEEL